MPTKKCATCLTEKEVVEFGTRSQRGKTYLRSSCRACEAAHFRARYQSSTDFRARVNASAKKTWSRHGTRYGKIEKENRKTNRAKYVLLDCRQADKRKGRESTLTLAQVEQLLAAPCSYCGAISSEGSVDRIDNQKGHTPENVLSSCRRCNYIRRDMPFEAWLVVSQAVRAANDAGLFGPWNPSIWNKNKQTER